MRFLGRVVRSTRQPLGYGRRRFLSTQTQPDTTCVGEFAGFMGYAAIMGAPFGVAYGAGSESVGQFSMRVVGAMLWPITLPALAALHLTGLDQRIPGLRDEPPRNSY